jgi:hypothetical protein
MKAPKILILMGETALVLSIIACVMNIGGPGYPSTTIPVSTEAVGELRSSLETAAVSGAISGEISLIFTEPQLTSYLYYQLQTQSQPFITNPQVYLQDGQLQVYGTAGKGYFQGTARIILSAGVDAQGQLVIDLTSADFGPLPVPNGLKEIITATIQEAYTGALGPVATGFRLQNITIANGIMTIIGRTK